MKNTSQARKLGHDRDQMEIYSIRLHHLQIDKSREKGRERESCNNNFDLSCFL